ncbi:MAG: hypothetical protein ACK2UO_20455 [Caldilineaceae bacterium]|jgi:hypothetical protein
MRKLLIVIMILALAFLLRPRGMWGEARRSWDQRNRIMRTLVVIIGVYLIYGLFKMYQAGMIPFW